MITSADNEKLKTIRKLRTRRDRERTGLCVAEGEDLVAAAERAGLVPEFVLVANEDVEASVLDSVSTLGSGTRVIGVFPQAWSRPSEADLGLYLHAVGDPGNVGTAIRSAHAFCDGSVVLGPGCADPYSPKAMRASMGSTFAHPPARAAATELPATLLALDPAAEAVLEEADVVSPLVVCVGAERQGLPKEVLDAAAIRARIALREGGPESLNAAMAATVALYQLSRRMARHV